MNARKETVYRTYSHATHRGTQDLGLFARKQKKRRYFTDHECQIFECVHWYILKNREFGILNKSGGAHFLLGPSPKIDRERKVWGHPFLLGPKSVDGNFQNPGGPSYTNNHATFFKPHTLVKKLGKLGRVGGVFPLKEEHCPTPTAPRGRGRGNLSRPPPPRLTNNHAKHF